MPAGRPPLPRVITSEQADACPDGARIIPLTQGFVAWVSEEDYDQMAKVNWSATKMGMSVYAIGRPDPGRSAELMHRLIMKVPRRHQVDHIRHREPEMVVDNRRENLREATVPQNRAYRRKSPGCASRYKGVAFDKRKKRWLAGIEINDRRRNLGLFKTELLAARAYDVEAIKTFGEFALPNFETPGATQWLFGPGGIQEAA